MESLEKCHRSGDPISVIFSATKPSHELEGWLSLAEDGLYADHWRAQPRRAQACFDFLRSVWQMKVCRAHWFWLEAKHLLVIVVILLGFFSLLFRFYLFFPAEEGGVRRCVYLCVCVC